MGIISWVILGALAGWIASMITGRNKQMGCLANIVVGIVGAIIGGVVGTLVAAQQRRKHCLGFRLLPPSLAFRSVQTKGDYAMLSADFRLVAVSF